MTSILAEVRFTGPDDRPNYNETISDGVTVIAGRWYNYAQKAWPGWSSSPNGTGTATTGTTTDVLLVRTQIMLLKTSVWDIAFHSTADPSFHRLVWLRGTVTMPETFLNFSGTGYGEDDLTAGLIYAGESDGKGWAWVYQRMSDGATTRIAHGYFTGSGSTGTFNQLGPAVSVSALAVSTSAEMIVQMSLDASGGMLTHTVFWNGAAVATFTMNSALYNAFLGTSIATSMIAKKFYQGFVCRYPAGLAQQTWGISPPSIPGTSIYSGATATSYMAQGAYHLLFDDLRVEDRNPALLNLSVDVMPTLTPSFVTAAGITLSTEDDGGSESLSLAPDYSQPIEDQYRVREFVTDSGHVLTRAESSLRRRVWSLHWEAMSPTDKTTLETLTDAVKVRFRTFNWRDPETNLEIRVRFISSARFDRVAFAVWRASAVIEEAI